MRPLEGRRFWFVGIGGAGMSALALVAYEWGAEVGGSDRARSSYVERLKAAGLPVAIGHEAANVPDDAEVIVSSAIAAQNPEVEVSRARVKRRAELLAELVGVDRGMEQLVEPGGLDPHHCLLLVNHALSDQIGGDPERR